MDEDDLTYLLIGKLPRGTMCFAYWAYILTNILSFVVSGVLGLATKEKLQSYDQSLRLITPRLGKKMK